MCDKLRVVSIEYPFGVEGWIGLALRGRRSLLVALCCCLMMSQSSLEASAFSFLGITLFEDQATKDAEAVIADPQNYDIEVKIDIENEGLDAAVRGASSLWTGRGRPASGAAGLLANARADYRRLVAALYAEGYYGPTVSILVDGREANDLPPDASFSDPAKVRISVQTGPEFHFGTILIKNQAGAALEEADQVASVESVGLSSGAVAKSGVLKRAARLAVTAWEQQGYPKAKIGAQNVVADHELNLLDISFDVIAGPRATIGAISVEGAKDMKVDFIIRQTGLIPGQEFDPDDIERAKERLAALDVFSSVKIVEADEVLADGSLPLTIVVSERLLRRTGVGATFSSTDGLGTEAFWQHRNLFGGAEHFKIEGKLAGISFPINSEEFDYYFGGTFTKPGVLTPDTDLRVALSAEHTTLKQYSENSVEGVVALSHTFSKQLSVEGGVSAKRANFHDATYGERDFAVWSTFGSVTYDTRDNPTDATEGLFAKFEAEPFYESENENLALLLKAEGRTYWSFGPDDLVVLAARAKLGLIVGPSVAETPPDKLFFSGGGGSVRGYSFRSIGVDGPGNTVTGGQFLTEASVEARVKVTENIGIVGFVDAGYVSADQFVGLDTGTRLGAGLGVRYNTGLGPLRLDVAVPLNKRAGDPNFGVYVGIGQAF